VTGIDRDLVVIKRLVNELRDEGRTANVEFIHTDLLTFHADRSLDGCCRALRFCSFNLTRLPQSPPAKQFVLKGSSSSMKWTSLTEFEATQMAHFSKGCTPSLRKRSDRRCPRDLGSDHLTHLFLNCWTPMAPRSKRRSRSAENRAPLSIAGFTETLRSLLPRMSSLVWQRRRTGARYACGENGSRSGHPPNSTIGPPSVRGLGLDIPSSALFCADKTTKQSVQTAAETREVPLVTRFVAIALHELSLFARTIRLKHNLTLVIVV